jgi:frataxin-like iron-binding protein CyaY
MIELTFESGLLKSPAVYDAEKQVLTLEFNRGGKYNYSEFTPQDWAEFIAADSKGKHFLRVIKPKFACTKLPPEETPDGAKSTSH